MSSLELATSDGLRLVGRWDETSEADMAMVFCHPHPQHGGTMMAPLMHKVTKALVADNFAVLRFNFRGVGGSSGEWAGGEGEVNDVAAAMHQGAQRDLPLAIGGLSFGAATALRWQAREGDATPFVGIAPPVDSSYMQSPPSESELAKARRLFILGDHDQFIAVKDLESYASSISANMEVILGSDHFFFFREDRVAALMAEFYRTK